MAQTGSAYWCFTLNNYGPNDETALQAFDCHYLVYGREVGASGTPHLQGYLELADGSRKRMRTVKELLGMSTIHLEKRKAKAWQAAEYCKKDGDFFEKGTAPTKPKEKPDSKKRWREVLDKTYTGDWEWLAENEPYLWLMQERKLRSHYKCPKLLDELTNEWIYGPTGTGKSRSARERYPDAYIKDASTQWWDGYNGEKVVIIDDLDKYHVKMGYYLKVWGDHYAFPAQIKGGQMMARPEKIIVTSNYHPREIWQDAQTVEPIERRYQVIERTPLGNQPGRPSSDFDFVFPPSNSPPSIAELLPEPDPQFVRAAEVLRRDQHGNYIV